MADTGSIATDKRATDFAFQAIAIAGAARIGFLTVRDQLRLARGALDESAPQDFRQPVAVFLDNYGADGAGAGVALEAAMRGWLAGQTLPDAPRATDDAAFRSAAPAPVQTPKKQEPYDWQRRADLRDD